MSQFTALLDANVLYPAPLRDLFMELAVCDLFRARWSADIHREWIEALMTQQPHRDRAALERTRDLMDSYIRDSLVTGYQPTIGCLVLPDPDDRHVLAAAIVGRCDVIVTQNLKDFPASVLTPYGIKAQHPDEFLSNHLHLSPGVFCSAVREIRGRLKSPPYTVSQYLETLRRQGLAGTVSDLQRFASLL